MRLSQRLIAASVLVALSGVLAGCSSSLSNFDPSDLLDFLDTKKKLPGERKPVFPDGVPGLEQGVPKNLYKGAVEQQQIDEQNAEAAAAAAPPPEQPKPKHTAKSRAKAKPDAADPDAAPEGEGSAAAPAPKPKKTVHHRTTKPPADQQEAAPAQAAPAAAAPSQQPAAPFPAPLPSGSFSR